MNGWDAVIAYIAVTGTVQLARVYVGYRAAKRRDEAKTAAAKAATS